MSVELEIRQASVRDAMLISQRLRDADRVEVEALSGLPAASAIAQTLTMPGDHFAFTEDRQVLMLLGVARRSMFGAECHPWMVMANGIERHRKELVRRSRRGLPRLLRGYSRAWNLVDDANHASIRYIAAMGFDLTRETIEIRGRTFRMFEKRLR